MTLALPPIGWLVIVSWTVLMLFAIATADAVQNPARPARRRGNASGAGEPVGYHVIEVSSGDGVHAHSGCAASRRPLHSRQLQPTASA